MKLDQVMLPVQLMAPKQILRAQLARRYKYEASVDMLASVVSTQLRTLLEKETGKLAAVLRSNRSLEQEFINVVVRHCLARFADEMHAAIEDADDWDDGCLGVHDLLEDRAPSVLKQALKGGLEPIDTDDPYHRVMTRIYEDRPLQREHYEGLAKLRQAQLRPLTVKDIPAVKAIYTPFVLTPDAVSQLAGGKEVQAWRTFFAPFDEEGGEKDKMAELLERTQWLSGRKSKQQRHASETMYGMGLWSPVADELLGVSIHTVGPLDPKKNTKQAKNYRARQEHLSTHGISGGTLTPKTLTQDELLKMYLSPRHTKLFLIIGKVVGAAMQVLAGNLAQLRPDEVLPRLREEKLDIKLKHDHAFVGLDSSMSTYYAGGLHIERSDERGTFSRVSTGPSVPGQNIGSEGFLKKTRYEGPVADDTNFDESVRRTHEVVRKRAIVEVLRTWPVWSHVTNEIRRHIRAVLNELHKLGA